MTISHITTFCPVLENQETSCPTTAFASLAVNGSPRHGFNFYVDNCWSRGEQDEETDFLQLSQKIRFWDEEPSSTPAPISIGSREGVLVFSRSELQVIRSKKVLESNTRTTQSIQEPSQSIYEQVSRYANIYRAGLTSLWPSLLYERSPLPYFYNADFFAQTIRPSYPTAVQVH